MSGKLTNILMRALLPAVCVFAAPCYAGSAGISVDPSYIKFPNVDLNGTVRLEKKAGYLLKFENTEGTGVTYEVSLHSCKESGIKPNGGYEDIPDTNWFVFKSTEVSAPARSFGYLRYLELSAPPGGIHERKKWQVVLKVAKKSGGAIGVQVLLPVWIETKFVKKSEKTTGERI